uniref:Annexin n=1 Tax=Panagrolaimus sp. ES5 TaxID=591445 RepID=A0AC34FIG7_9BILA
MNRWHVWCEEYHGTINGPDDEDFHPEEASKSLRQALGAGIQCDDKVLIQVLLRHDNFQRQKIAAAYEGQYDRILVDDVEDVLGGFFLDCTLALLQPAHLYSTKMLHYAISSRATNRPIAVEIAITSTSSQLKVIRDTYYTEYRISLERDLNVKVEGLFGQMLKDLLLRPRDPDSTAVDLDYVDHMIEIIAKPENGVEELGRNHEIFEKIFLNQSLIQLRSFFDRYDTQAMRASADSDSPKVRDFETAVRKSVNMHSDIRHMILLFVKIARNIQLYFAEKLHEAIIAARCDPSTIIRILVSRSEIDLYDICEEYKRKYGKSMVTDLKEACSGDFYRLLKQLVDPQNIHLSFEDSN